MKLTSLLLALILIPTYLISQRIVNHDNTWTYYIYVDGYSGGGTSYSYPELINLNTEEIILDNKTYYEVITPDDWYDQYSCELESPYLTNHFVREDSLGRVYVRDSFTNDNLIYDFTLSLNDTFLNEVTNEVVILIEKDSIELNNGTKREVFYFDNDEFWIKGFGSSERLFNVLDELFVLCFKEDCETLYIGSQGECFVWPVSTEKLDDNKIRVYPNPTNSNIKIELPNNQNLNIELFNINGKPVKITPIKNKDSITVELLNIKDGIYFLKIGEDVKKIVIMK